MPDEITELRDLYLTAMQNTVSAEDASGNAVRDQEIAQANAVAAFEAMDAAQEAEKTARAAYVRALRAHGYVDTASGPAPAPRICECGHSDTEHDDDDVHACESGYLQIGGRQPGIKHCACLAFRPAGGFDARVSPDHAQPYPPVTTPGGEFRSSL